MNLVCYNHPSFSTQRPNTFRESTFQQDYFWALSCWPALHFAATPANPINTDAARPAKGVRSAVQFLLAPLNEISCISKIIFFFLLQLNLCWRFCQYRSAVKKPKQNKTKTPKANTHNQNYCVGKRFYGRPDSKGSFGRILREEKSNREKRKGMRVEGQGE